MELGAAEPPPPPEPGYDLLMGHVHQIIAALILSAFMFAFCCGEATRYFRRTWRNDKTVFRSLVSFTFAMTVTTLLIQAVECINVVDAAIQVGPTLRGALDHYKWLVVELFLLLPLGFAVEAFFTHRAVKVTRNRYLRLLPMLLLFITTVFYLTAGVFTTLTMKDLSFTRLSLHFRRGAIWSHFLLSATNTGLMLYPIIVARREHSGRKGSKMDLLGSIASGVLKTQGLLTINAGACAITALLLSSADSGLCLFFWFHVYPSFATLCVIFTLNQRQTLQDIRSPPSRKTPSDTIDAARSPPPRTTRHFSLYSEPKEDPGNWRGDLSTVGNSRVVPAHTTSLLGINVVKTVTSTTSTFEDEKERERVPKRRTSRLGSEQFFGDMQLDLEALEECEPAGLSPVQKPSAVYVV